MSASLFAGLFALYALTAYPTIAPRDAADLAAAALALGLAHPPGYPLYSCLGKLWTILLPFGDFGYRLNLLSATAGAGAGALLFTALRARAGAPWAAAAALGFALSPAAWKFASLGEKYSLQALFAAALLALAEGQPRGAPRRAAASALLLGLGLVNHQTLVLLVPALAALWRAPARALSARDAGFAAGVFALGLGLNLFVWVRLGDWSLAWAVLSRAEYGSFELYAGLARPLGFGTLASLLWYFAFGLLSQTPALAAGAAASGAAGEPSARTRLAALLLGLGAVAVFFAATRFDVSLAAARSAIEPAFILAQMLLAWAAAEGFSALARSRPAPAVGLAAAAVLLPLLTGAPRAFARRGDFSAWDYAAELRRCVPPGALAIVHGDTALFGQRYLERIRPSSRRLVSSLEPPGAELPSRVIGLPLERLDELKLPKLAPAGLCAGSAIDPALDAALWELSVLRPGAWLDSPDSYAFDARYGYASARFLAARLLERAGKNGSAHDRWAVRLAPEAFEGEFLPLLQTGPLPAKLD